MSLSRLKRSALRAELTYLAARQELTIRFTSGDGEDGLRALLSTESGGEEVFFAVSPLDASYLSLSLVLVVDEDFFRTNVEDILDVTSRYEVSASLARDDGLGEGEVYLHLALRLFLVPLTEAAFALSLENLRAARDALAAAFP